ncbi:unnamed protein product [Gadus morhua 'NCC']
MVDRICRTVRVKEQPCVEPAEVLCDFCTGTQLKAVKSCLVCYTSYCQTHLEPHQRVARLQKHLLVDPLDRLEDRVCKKHNRLLEFFCQTDQVCVCEVCKRKNHKSHPVVPMEEEYKVKMTQLWKMEAKVQQMICERKLKSQDINDTANHSKAEADREMAAGRQVLIALKRFVEKCLDDFDQTVQEKVKSTEKEAAGLIKELGQEIEDLTNISSEVKQLSHTKDHLHLLQTFRSLKDPPTTRDWAKVEFHPPSYEGTLDKEMKKLVVLEPTLKKLWACPFSQNGRILCPSMDVSYVRRAEENRHPFLDKELKELWLLPDYPQCSESKREEEEAEEEVEEEVEEEDGKKEEQRRRAIEGVVDITKLCLVEMNQEELADTLWGS